MQLTAAPSPPEDDDIITDTEDQAVSLNDEPMINFPEHTRDDWDSSPMEIEPNHNHDNMDGIGSGPLPITEAGQVIQAFSSCGYNRRVVAITFDDGPTSVAHSTERLLQELASLNMKATFYSTPAAMGEWELSRRW